MPRTRPGQWLLALGVLAVCLAGIGAYTAFLQMNQEPMLRVLAPGEVWQGRDARLEVLKLETLKSIPGSTLSRGPGVGGIYVAVTMRAQVTSEDGDVVCSGDLMATDGRTWRRALEQLPDSSRCPVAPSPQPTTFVTLYAIPERDVGNLAGIVVRSFLTQQRVLLRPAG